MTNEKNDFELNIPKFQILPHKYAPMFSKGDGELILNQLISEAMTGNYPTEVNSEFITLLSQLGFVSLWGFLKIIAAHNGPYESLTPHLHNDMCNFYQNSMYSGSKAACFIGRSHFKSSVYTHGANTWELLRNPEIHIALGCGLAERAYEFLHYTQDTIAENELFDLLYGSGADERGDPWGNYVPENTRSQQGWNDEMLTLPNKTRNRRTPNIKPMTAGGSTAGIHADLLKLDDIISDSDLDSNRSSSASMHKMGNWLKSSIRTLVKDWKTSRAFLSGTRYAVDDAYEPVMQNCKKQIGYWDELPDHYQTKDNGEWDIYYRMIEEKGRIIFPEAFTKEGLAKLAEDDWWTYATQYANNPFIAGSTELHAFSVNECMLDTIKGGDMVVTFFNNGEYHDRFLRDLNIMQLTDPAATEKGISAKTSRSAHVVMAVDWEDNLFILDGHADYVAPSKIYEWNFNAWKKFKGLIQKTGMELRGPFKVFEYLMRDEQEKRKVNINFRPIKTVGDKDARIRTALEGPLKVGRLYCIKSFKDTVEGEMKTFPNGKKKDVLDVISMGANELKAPKSPEEKRKIRRKRILSTLGEKNKVTGY